MSNINGITKLWSGTLIVCCLAALSAAFAAEPTTRLRPLQGQVSKQGGFRIPRMDNSMQGNVNTRGAFEQGVFDKEPRNLSGSSAVLDLGDQRFTLKDQLDILSRRNVAVVVDRSTSMKEDDCPGDTSRWEWCQNQAQFFTRQTAGVLNNGITLALFSRDYDIYPNVTVDQVRNIFSRTKCKMGTKPERPLRAILGSYLSGPMSKPLSIAVVSDGEPNDPEDLAQLITETTWRMNNPDQISITFLQVGTEHDGTKILNALDNHLVRQGAKYDIVDYKNFYDLQRMGLMGAIVASVHEAAPVPKFVKNAPARKRANSPSQRSR
jgi:hypothetical protein